MGLPEQDYFGSQPEVGKQPIAMVPLSTLPERKKYESCQEIGDEVLIHQHFMSNICANILLPILQNLNVIGEKLHKTLLYKKSRT